jgi:hypothetical protein
LLEFPDPGIGVDFERDNNTRAQSDSAVNFDIGNELPAIGDAQLFPQILWQSESAALINGDDFCHETGLLFYGNTAT